ncbi:hypothetical protein ACM66B_000308 [Microbotryomycetes sp. NB124-2]
MQMGQTQSAPSSPLAGRENNLASLAQQSRSPTLKGSKKRRPKSSSNKTASSTHRGSWPPHRKESLVAKRSDEQLLRARFAAEEKLSGRGQRGDTPSSFGSVARSPVWGRNESESSPELDGLGVRVGGQKLSRMRVKRTASGKPDLLASPPPTNLPSLFVTMQDIGESTFQPPGAAVPTIDAAHPMTLAVPGHNSALMNSPKSHWSESSVGCPTPPEPLHSFRDSLNLALNPKRLSSSSGHRLSALIGSGPEPESPTSWRASSNGTTAHTRRKHKGLKKRGPIVVVGVERMGSDRYSMMKAAAAQSASTRKANSADSSSRPLSREVEEDIVTARDACTSRDAIPSQIPFPSSPRTRRNQQVPDSPKRQSSAEELLTFIAASPDLTCADPNAPLFDTQATPKKSINRLPDGHPGNHHARFRHLQKKPSTDPGADAPVSSANSAKTSEFSTLRRDSSQSRRSSTSSAVIRRKLSNIRLSICEVDMEEDGEVVAPEHRRGSSASWSTSRSRNNSADATATARRKSSSSSLRRASTVATAHGRGSVNSITMPFIAPVAPLRPRPVSSTSRMSFPHSVTGTSDATETPKREARRSSNATSYFGKQDLPTTPESLPSPPPLPALPAAGEINWASYSLTNLVSPVTSPGASTESRSSYIAPETVDAFPMPPSNRLQSIAPAPLLLARNNERRSSRPPSFPSDASTPSSAASSVETATSLTLSEGVMQQQQDNAVSLYSLMPFINTAQLDSKGNLTEPTSPALSGGGRSSGEATVCTAVRQQPDTSTTPAPSSTVRRPSVARLESPVIQLWPAEPLPRSSANVRESRVLQFSDFKLEFATPKISSAEREPRSRIPQGLLDCVSPTQDVLDALTFEDDEELEAVRHRFPSSNELMPPSPSIDLSGLEDEMNKMLLSLEDEDDEPVEVGNARRHYSTTALPSPPPLVTVPAVSGRRDTHPTWVPPSMRNKDSALSNGFDFGQGLRLGSSDKRGFDRHDVTDWLKNQS